MSIFLNACAKINFGLCITERRDDGFHNIETIFYPLSLCDKLTLEKADTYTLKTDSDFLNNEEAEGNLITRAVRLLERETNLQLPVSVTLEKRIPLGAGLGGGSSDAAMALLGTMQLFHIKLPQERLQSLALELGSDVPYFLLPPQAAFAKSRGEKLKPISFAINKPILIVNPGIHVSTAWAYKHCKPKKPDFSLLQLDGTESDDYSQLMGKVVNDFQETVFGEHRKLQELYDSLLAFDAEFVLMSGSGSTLFAIFTDMERLVSAKEKLPEHYFSYIEKPHRTEH